MNGVACGLHFFYGFTAQKFFDNDPYDLGFTSTEWAVEKDYFFVTQLRKPTLDPLFETFYITLLNLNRFAHLNQSSTGKAAHQFGKMIAQVRSRQ